MKFRNLLVILGLLLVFANSARALETLARAAMVMDYNTGTILLEKNADEPIPPASMSKLMTLNMVFEALEQGRLTLDDRLPVSQHAMSYGGSTMFLNTRDRVRVEDLIRGVIVLSGNDACAVLAEALAGTEAEFARAMTRRAAQLGMKNSTFANSNGWPDPDQKMSARDLVILAERLIRQFPQYYHYFAETEFAFDNRSPANRHNRNPLLSLGIGADGLKTGHTSEAGYGLVGSGQRDGRRIVLMISGLGSESERAQEAEKLMNWGFRQFVEKKILEPGQTLGSVDVWLGEEPQVALQTRDAVEMLLPVAALHGLKAEIITRAPVRAPIAAGDELATLRIDIPEMPSVKIPLVAAKSVASSGFLSRLRLSAAILAKTAMDTVR